MDGAESVVKDRDAFVVPAGTKHNVINLSNTDSPKLYTVYSPPHHKDGVTHKTKADAEMDKADQFMVVNLEQ